MWVRHRCVPPDSGDTTTVAIKRGTTRWKRRMITMGLCWPIIVLCYICQGTTSYLLSAQTNNEGRFKLVKGVRQVSLGPATHRAYSTEECAIMCAQGKSCSNFNFAFGECELLSVASSCRTYAPGWTHGHYPTGKCKKKRQSINSLTWKIDLQNICSPSKENLLSMAVNREKILHKNSECDHGKLFLLPSPFHVKD